MGIIVSQKLFPLIIKYIEIPLKNGQTGCYVPKGEEEEKKYKEKMKELQTQWLQPNWSSYNDLIRESTVYDQFRGERDIDPCLYRALTLDKFLKHWDAMDDENKPVECSAANIANLDVAIAQALVEAFNKHNVPTEEYLKN